MLRTTASETPFSQKFYQTNQISQNAGILFMKQFTERLLKIKIVRRYVLPTEGLILFKCRSIVPKLREKMSPGLPQFTCKMRKKREVSPE